MDNLDKMNSMDKFAHLTLTDAERWRLLLGEASQPILTPQASHDDTVIEMDTALSWLYGRDKADDDAQHRFDRMGGDGGSTLSTPDWINQIQTLFPQETIERLEKDALEQYHLNDLVTRPEVLERATPNPTLLAAVLKTKHLMNPDVLAMARKLVAKVVKDLMDKLQQEVIQSFYGQKSPIRYKKSGSLSQFAIKQTLKRNLKNYQPEQQQLIVNQPYFFLTERNNPKKWQIILVIDQSGSMVSSVIHSAVMAGCFWQLPNMKTHLIAFDTQVVDLTDDVADPVELLMQVQLGGGTDIAKAMQYASELVVDCQRSIVVLVSDFYEGGNEMDLIATTKALCDQGTKVLALAALDSDATPNYCHTTAKKLVNVGALVSAMTPLELANWLASVIK